MATVSSMPPILRMRRSAQSGARAMTAAYAVVYTENTTTSALAYIFNGAIIDLSPMLAGDVINIRVRKILVPSGSFVIHDVMTYRDAQPATHPAIHILSIPDIYGVEIAMQQTAGVLRTVNVEAYDAKRLGLT